MKLLANFLTNRNLQQYAGAAIAACLATAVVTHQLWQPGFPYTHDGENHLARFANYYVALKEGQIPPRFAPNLHNHYGYPVFNYNYPLANILSVPFTSIDVSLETTFKVLAALAVGTGFLGCVAWLRLRNATWWGSVLGAWGASSSPIVISTLLFRGNIGELWAWGLLPWLLAGVELTLQRQLNWLEKVGMWLALTTFLLSHNVTVLFGLALVWVYALLRQGLGFQLATTRQFVTWQLVGFLSSCWFWVPALLEKKFITLDGVDLSKSFIDHFSTWKQLLSSPVSFGFSQLGSVDSLSLSAGVWFWVCILLVLGYTGASLSSRQKLPQILSLDTAFLLLTLLVFQLSFTAIIWQHIPFAQFIQFPWRLLLLLSVISANLFMRWHNWPHSMRWLVVLALCVQSVVVVRTAPVDRFHRTTEDYLAFSQTTTTQNENMPKTFTYQDIAHWQPTPSVLAGSAIIAVQKWSGSRRSYTVDVITPTTVVEPTMYFPGWQTIVTSVAPQQNRSYKVVYKNSEVIGGRVAYTLEPGTYFVRSRFTEWTLARLVGDALTIMSILLLGVWIYQPWMFIKKNAGRDENI